ncbi:hypothetical protein [Kitasatospora purpeofusca]|uniref:hypothetical protein n=1 Tax=Kitasatospora purpeofusca TaxID=67352 RepID=UPI002253149B|nr:hypothetical protein [Kitasatospora purpeofusca]MCX4759306.1 hypothetical protein [Kitasatospora purpeofusca]WSR30300.1 hypothetical protein OG715_04630 [Kitasatospora purpeofusca]WSR38533.1 hypothetical protein OG196_05225 [Kitasatospora purpeofusca]
MTERDFAAWEREAALDRETALDRAVADDHEVVDELRVLLQLAAPHLSAPADRMDRVLARAALARRRRRRAALAAGLAVGLTAAVLAAAPALAPGPTGTVLGPAASGPALGAMPAAGAPSGAPAGSPEASASASPGPGSGDPRSPSPAESPSVGADGGSTDGPTGDAIGPLRPTRFTLLDGVIIDVPDAWSELTLLGTAERPGSVGYLASQSIAREPGCPIRNGVQQPVCLAAGGLLDNSMIVSVRVLRDEKLATEAAGRSALLRDTELDKDCAIHGGSRQLVAQQVVIPNGKAEVVELSACLRRPAQETLSTLYRLTASVRLFGTATNSQITSTG